MRTSHMFIAAAAAAAAVAVAVTGSVIAAGGATVVSVTNVASLTSGQRSPDDAPGVKAIRKGKAIPAGYRLIGQRVRNKRGTPGAAAALFFRCPAGKRLRTFMTTGNVGFVSTLNYLGHRETWVRTAPARLGQTSTGIVYAVCR